MMERVPSTSSELASIAFVDLAGFSAIADVYGDATAMSILSLFEDIVRDALGGLQSPVKWIGDEVMLDFPSPDAALRVLGALLPACRLEPRIPLTRTALNHGPVIRRGQDVFGSTVNIAARLAARASPGELLTTEPVALCAAGIGIEVRDLGEVQLRSVATPTKVFSIEIAPTTDLAWIDPVCKMHAPFHAYRRKPEGPWFCSEVCAEAYRKSPEAYQRARN